MVIKLKAIASMQMIISVTKSHGKSETQDSQSSMPIQESNMYYQSNRITFE